MDDMTPDDLSEAQVARLAELGLFDARAPRYTSYPTSPHFTPDVGAADFERWIRAIPPGAEISLYMHVPFCRRLCWFCACHTQGTKSDDPVIAYARVLKDEIALLAARLPAGVRLSRLHWGGGTPTMLPPDEIRALSEAIFTMTPMAPGGEFSVEIDPSEIDDARLDALAAAGMNRASIGVQDFDPLIQKAIGRIQSYELTRDVADAIRARGVTSLNMDLLYGLPHQDVARITDSVQKLLSLAPDRVALFGYAHVPWASRRQKLIDESALPLARARLQLSETARALFLADGYAEIGIDHFARPGDGLERAAQEGRLRRNFQGYTDDAAAALIGIGASSISRFPQGFAQNSPMTPVHVKAIREGRFSTSRGHAFGDEDLVRARMIEALMCDFRIRRDELLARFDLPAGRIDEMFAEVAGAFDGIARIEDGDFVLPPAGRPLTRIMARAFDAYDQSALRHSVAI